MLNIRENWQYNDNVDSNIASLEKLNDLNLDSLVGSGLNIRLTTSEKEIVNITLPINPKDYDVDGLRDLVDILTQLIKINLKNKSIGLESKLNKIKSLTQE